ncbi:hypothetical protein PSTT_02272 [Puccinia striiformis]|uniref:Uncharacterized protein n=1 Tax=Puccinia striiformis TaxID=27350 RepID=A0A2S4W0S5_9BASI|nr:hypothetical protein PSTT_02272 [Puccinia striiformis]
MSLSRSSSQTSRRIPKEDQIHKRSEPQTQPNEILQRTSMRKLN